VRDLLNAHLEGRADLRKPLWTVLMFQLWRRHHAQAVSLRSAA
jgi:asparagine synthase (glutamine-hydrolysing)